MGLQPHGHGTGARRVGGTRSGGLRKLLPLLLGLVLAIALAVLLISLIGGDDSDDGGNTGSNSGQLAAGGVSLLPPLRTASQPRPARPRPARTSWCSR
jgi:hypothetical protein